VTLLGRVLEGILEIDYSHLQEKELEYGAGTKPIGTSEGNYEAKASITLIEEEKRALLSSLPPGSSIMDLPPFDIPMVFSNGPKRHKDVLRFCEFTGSGVKVAQGDKKIEGFKYELLVVELQENVP